MIQSAQTQACLPDAVLTRRVTILGATGSVGASTCDLIAQARSQAGDDACPIDALTAQTNWRGLAEAALKFRPRLAAIGDLGAGARLKDALAGSDVEVAVGPGAVLEAARGDSGWVMAAIVGAAGLGPTLAAAERGACIALANKEALVCAGSLVMAASARAGGRLLPVDSEHNAIFQVLAGLDPSDVKRIVLTASGGPFRTWTRAEMASVTPEQAIAHPTWSMGEKISIDCASLMNKGLELIEARHLFGVDPDRLDVLVHPQSVVHGLIECVDASVLAQMAPADMRVPIAHALAWPARMTISTPPLDLARVGTLTFETPDLERFPALGLARAAMEAGGDAPNVLNAANEVAVARFLDRKIGFLDIPAVVEEALDQLATAGGAGANSLDDVLEVDRRARRAAETAALELAS